MEIVARPGIAEVDFESSVRSHYPALVRRLALIVRDPSEAEDIAQAAYLAAYRAWHRFDGRDVRAWLYTIALRLAFRERRRRQRWFGLFRDAQDAREAVDGGWRPDERLDLWQALGSLAARERAALLLSVLDGYTHAEIGAILGVPAGTVGSWLSRAKARLRERLSEE